MSMRTLLIAGGAAVLVLLAAAGGSYVYFFSGLRSAPQALALSPAPASSATTATPAATSALAGSWTVASGSVARYRVSEQFAGQTSSHEAVAASSTVSGGFSATADGSGYQLSAVKITVGLAGLQSQDTVAGFNVSQRDRIVQQSLSTGTYPDATFEASSVDVPSSIDAGQPVTMQLPGKLTIHGVTKEVTFTVQVQTTASGAQAVGSTKVTMTDFGVNPPQIPITVVQPQVTLEFQLNLARS